LPSYQGAYSPLLSITDTFLQALTGYGAVSVYGPQIFELLGFGVSTAEYITLGNYLFYLAMMTFAWILIDVKGRRWLLVTGAFWLAVSFALLAVLGCLAMHRSALHIPLLATGIPGIITLYLATAVFGVCWLTPPWLIPTEIYPSTARAQGAAVSVIIWGLANFAVTLLTPIGFNNLKYYLFAVFCLTNIISGVWTYLYCPESGQRTFEENQEFFSEAAEKGSWSVHKVKGGVWRRLPAKEGEDEENVGGNGKKGKSKADGEQEPLLGRRENDG
jgi:Sugar (and other) transporter